jgi:hypothetical protein
MKLTDTEAYDLLHKAAEVLASGKGESVRAETALRAGEKMLFLLQMGLVSAMENNGDNPTRLTDPSPAQLPD